MVSKYLLVKLPMFMFQSIFYILKGFIKSYPNQSTAKK